MKRALAALLVTTLAACSGGGGGDDNNIGRVADRDLLVVFDEDDEDAVVDALERSDAVAGFAELPVGVAPTLLVRTGTTEECDARRGGAIVDVESNSELADVVPDADIYTWSDVAPEFNFEPYDIELYLNVDATEGQIDAVARALDDDERIAEVEFINQAQALVIFGDMFWDRPDIVQDTTADALPPSFRLTTVDDMPPEKLFATYKSFSGVASAAAPTATLDAAERFEALLRTTPVQLPQGVEIFMDVDATEASLDAVRSALENDGNVEEFEFVDKDDALEKFREIFVDQPELVESTTAAELPVSFRVQLDRNVDAAAWLDRYAALDGVHDIFMSDAVAYC